MQNNIFSDYQNRPLNLLQYFTLPLTIIGALNWGLLGAFDFDLVKAIFSESVLTKITYIAVGVAGIVQALIMFKKFVK